MLSGSRSACTTTGDRSRTSHSSRRNTLDRIRRGFILGPPDLALEIVSPDSVERDYEKKRRQYEEFRVREYWIVDESLKKTVLLRLDARGEYREVRPRKGILRSQVIRSFWIETDWLWQTPRPDELETLQKVLAG
jgi:Uma2 family endonuclease